MIAVFPWGGGGSHCWQRLCAFETHRIVAHKHAQAREGRMAFVEFEPPLHVLVRGQRSGREVRLEQNAAAHEASLQVVSPRVNRPGYHHVQLGVALTNHKRASEAYRLH